MTTPEIPDVLINLLGNSPWAVVAYFLLRHVIDRSNEDRKQVTDLIGKFQVTLEGLKSAVERLTQRLDHVETHSTKQG